VPVLQTRCFEARAPPVLAPCWAHLLPMVQSDSLREVVTGGLASIHDDSFRRGWVQ
jgi:hypothetical protein